MTSPIPNHPDKHRGWGWGVDSLREQSVNYCIFRWKWNFMTAHWNLGSLRKSLARWWDYAENCIWGLQLYPSYTYSLHTSFSFSRRQGKKIPSESLNVRETYGYRIIPICWSLCKPIFLDGGKDIWIIGEISLKQPYLIHGVFWGGRLK